MNLTAAGLMACLLLFQDPTPPRKTPPVTVRVDTLFAAGAPVTWHTIILEVTNQTGADQEFHISAGIGGADRAVRREKFATKVRKRLFLYLPATFPTNRINVLVADASGRELLNQDTEVSLAGRGYGSSGTTLVAALMEHPPKQMPTNSVVKVVEEDLFPDRWIGLAGVDIVYLRDYKLDALLPAQREALSEWVRRGGRVVLYAGSNRDWLKSPAVQELAPVILGESSEVTEHRGLDRKWGRFREKTPFALHEILNGQPMAEGFGGAARFPRGNGWVIVLPFDLESAPFDYWPGTTELREALANWRKTPERSGQGQPLRLTSNVDLLHRNATSRVNQLPPFPLLLTLTLLYLVAVGPVNFLILRRLKMSVRLVFTIPAISVAFLGIVIACGYLLRGVSTVTFDVCVLEAAEGDGTANERHLVSIFSPTSRTFDITFGENEIGNLREFQEDEDPWSRHSYRTSQMPSVEGVIFDQTDRWTLRGVPFQQWQSRAFIGDAVRSIDGGVKFNIGSDYLEIINKTPYGIRKGWALDRSPQFVAYAFGDVPAGETKKFPLMPAYDAHRRDDWMDAPTLETRVTAGLIFMSAREQFSRPYLICVLDRLPDEITLNARRSGDSERVCLLQVEAER